MNGMKKVTPLLLIGLLAGCLLAPVAVAVSDRELHEADKPVLVERDVEVTPVRAARESESEDKPHAVSLGEFEITAYCPCPLCCGKDPGDPEYGITATGTRATAERTVAVDPDVIPLGSVLYIGGYRYIAEDVGGAIQGNIIDIYMESHDKALEFGRQKQTVYIFK